VPRKPTPDDDPCPPDATQAVQVDKATSLYRGVDRI